MEASEELFDVCVVGAGAAGLWAAERAAREGARVLLLEKTPRTGTKVLASGGTRCNLTTTLEPEEALPWFGPVGARFLTEAVWNLPPSAIRIRFEQLGVPSVEAPLEKVFPESGRARDVRDALERAVREAGVHVELNHGVAHPSREDSTWRLRAQGGVSWTARRLVLATGGRSYPSTGTTGDGYTWLRDLGLPIVEPVPALVPLRSQAAWVHALTGIALQDVEGSVVSPRGRRLECRRRPILFTHEGLSGPCAMDLSGRIARGLARGERGWSLSLDLLPELEREQLRERIVAGAGARGAPRLSEAVGLSLPKRVWSALGELLGDGPDPRCGELSKEARHAWIEHLKGVPIPVSGTLGFDKAEVTGGGLDLRVVDPPTCRVRGVPDLWVCGELLDLQGPIGGFSFLAAWATAELAGASAATGC